MRTLLGISVVAVFVVGVWVSIPTIAKQNGVAFIDPANLTAAKTNLPTEQYDAF